MSRIASHKILAALFFFTLVFSNLLFAVPQEQDFPEVQTYKQLVHAIRGVQSASQKRIEQSVDREKVREAWETGRLIHSHVLFHKERAAYGKEVLKHLSNDLGMSKTELEYRVQFAKTYPIAPPAGQLSWAHYREILSLEDVKEREEVTRQAEEQNWTRAQVREEIRRRRFRTQAPEKLPEMTPGPLNTYKIIRLKNHLKIDLGFGIYHDLAQKDAGKFKEGEFVVFEKGKLKKTPEALLFTYQAVVTQGVDGDTFHALIDLGFGITLAQRVRLRRVDAAELETAEGKEAKIFLEKILARDQGRILMRSIDLDQHGRPLADVWVKGKLVDQELLEEGLAVPINE